MDSSYNLRYINNIFDMHSLEKVKKLTILNCDYIEELNLPSNIKELTILNCNNLVSINSKLDMITIYRCNSLKYVNLSNNVSYLSITEYVSSIIEINGNFDNINYFLLFSFISYLSVH